MKTSIDRRSFLKTSVFATSALPLATRAAELEPAAAQVLETQPMGRIGGQEFSRLMLGGNLIGAFAHSRDLSYVSMLMRRYNTESKIRETLELAEAHGINTINTWVMQENSAIFAHWKAGGKMKWFAQVRLEGGSYRQIDQAVDQGAAAIHLTGDACEILLASDQFDKVGDVVEYIRYKKRLAGVAAHDLRVIAEAEKRKVNPDFYLKTLHSHDYFTAPKQGETDPVGRNDNSWCSDPQAVIDLMANVRAPWIAFKILAAGAVPPRTAFPYAFTSGADHLLVGMFDWQVADNAKLAKRTYQLVSRPGSKRTRPWAGGVSS